MILWTFKLVSSVRKAIAGRRYPSQLAWAVAFGVLLGLIPHGNLVAASVLVIVLALQLNHAMAALTAIGVTFLAPKLDPVFHAVGERILTHPEIADRMTTAWSYPLMPWTSLNNTVVVGSLAIGLVSLLPTFALTYPVFRGWSRGLLDAEKEAAEQTRQREAKIAANRVIRDQQRTQAPSTIESKQISSGPTASSGRVFDIRRIDSGHDATVPAPTTRVEIAPRQSLATANAAVKNANQNVTLPASGSGAESAATVDEQQKIDEALRYLLKQLRDSQDKDAA
ncbi:MAG: TIGR03546 family protein [Planctomycetota bacterium]